ncbi:hypothetical protein [Flammeovirga kamogawensis]|uniref:MarR family transcriptional regulator n=1 Tax=Flammeovirga kamogawensis TaxID=373891 RepID=A0ABX8GZW3_9BACT|nr:hypothetical protein [Flammeovirga kamogawensis]MBB6459386.1 hypothetical protein [Flammeovirga kamogawensis]QWG08943.1 hypothetical protein KM029_08360 [Flammeovirga kamogawensis]TRX67234.1 hypothetical protein EO216_03410 [Flammeovirga kamogawensis]
MSIEIKQSKLLMGICLHSGECLEEVAKNLGLCTTRDEIEVLASLMENDGLLDGVHKEFNKTHAELTSKGVSTAFSLLENH